MGHVAGTVATHVRSHLASLDHVVESVPVEARQGHQLSQVLHVEPDGTFSVVALISKPGQATSIHDHTTWCVVAVIAGTEHEERFRLNDTGNWVYPPGIGCRASVPQGGHSGGHDSDTKSSRSWAISDGYSPFGACEASG